MANLDLVDITKGPSMSPTRLALSMDQDMRHIAKLLLVPAVLALPSPAAAAAAQKNAPPAQAPAAQNTASLPSDGGTGWRVECANDGKELDCRTINRVSHRETHELIAAVAIRIPPDIKKPV